MSIYTSSRQRPVTLNFGTPNVDVPIDGWTASTAIVDNYSNSQYVYLPGAPKYIDPGVRHAIVPLSNVGSLSASFTAPPGIRVPALTANDLAMILFLEDSHPASSGMLPMQGTPQLAATPQVNTLNIPAGQSAVFTVPPGALWFSYSIPSSAANSYPFTIVGSGGTVYQSLTIPVRGGTTPPTPQRPIRLTTGDVTLTVNNNSVGGLAMTGDLTFHFDPPPAVCANDGRFWQNFTNTTTVGQVTQMQSVSGANLPPQYMKTVLDEAVFTVSAGAGRVFTCRVWDGPVGSGTIIAAEEIGIIAGGTITAIPPVRFSGYKSSEGNSLGFDFAFNAATGEVFAISANGHYE